jgi:hypothetical protein
MPDITGYYRGHTGANAHDSMQERDECVICLLHRIIRLLDRKDGG